MLLVLSCLAIIPASVIAAPVLNSNTILSSTGYFQLSWSYPEATETSTHQYELQQADSPDFINANTLYQGPDQATVISGMPDQSYYYRVRLTQEESWSEALEVEVKHHSLSRAFGFFFLGAAMFIATIIALVKGVRDQE